MRKLFLISLLAIVAVAAHADVTVSPYIITTSKGVVTVPATRMVTIPVTTNAQPGDEIAVSLVVQNAVYKDISAYIMDQTNLNLFEQGVQGQIQGVTKQIQPTNKPIQFTAKVNAYGTYLLVLDNSYAAFVAKHVSWSVAIRNRLPDAKVQQIKSDMEKSYSRLKDGFVFTDFNIHIQPCGTPNAFSNPDVTICWELLTQLVEQHENDALSFIMLHELGHSLMNVWGLPAYNNEDMADQFAAAVLLRGQNGVESLDKAMEWFSSQNSLAQAQYMLTHGDPHALSVQRIRNIQSYIANPGVIEQRWNHVFYPHMTATALKGVIAHPDQYDDVALAKQFLALAEAQASLH